MRLKIRLVTALWGREFVATFLDVGLRSLIANGNILDLARKHAVIYTIYTTAEDAEHLRMSPLFQRICGSVDVRVSLFTAGEINAADPGSHGILWRRGLDLAKRNQEILFLIIPDLLYGAGTLLRWAQQFEKGFRAVYTPGPFVVLETALKELRERFPSNEEPITLQKEDVTRFLARHLHPLEAAMMRDAPARAGHPEHDIRAVDRTGFVIRPYTSQPFCIDAAYFTRIRSFNPEDHLDDVCVETCSAVSVEPLFKNVHQYYRPYPLDEMAIDQLASWWRTMGVPGCVRESQFTYDFPLTERPDWERGRARATVSGRFLRSQIMAAGKIFQVWQELASRGYYWAAALVASAHFVGRLRRRLVIRSRAVIFVPNDQAITAAIDGPLRGFLQPGKERDLVNLIKEHIVIPTRAESSITTWRTANGTTMNQWANDASIIDGPFSVEDLTVYVVDRVFFPASVPMELVPEHNAALVSTVKPSAFPLIRRFQTALRLWRKGGGKAVLAHVAHRTGVVWLLRGVKHRFVNPIAVKARAGGGRTLRVAWHIADQGLRRMTLWSAPIPRVSQCLRLVHTALDLGRREGGKAVLIQLSHRYRTVSRAHRTLHGTLERHRLLAGRVPRGYRYLRKHGLKATWWRLRHRQYAGGKVGNRSPSLPYPSIALLNEVRYARALEAIEGVLAHYQETALPAEMVSAPLAFVRDQLTQLQENREELLPFLQRKLETLVKKHPMWSEAWLELGYIQNDTGQGDQALSSFRSAALGQRLSDRDFEGPDPRQDAYMLQARIQIEQGNAAAAETAYAAGLALDPSRPRINIEFGKFLWRQGKCREAGQYLFWGMPYEPHRSPVPVVGRNASNFLKRGCSAAQINS